MSPPNAPSKVPAHRVLVIDDTEGIHQDFRKILGAHQSGAIDELEASLFGESPVEQPATAFELFSAHQGQEGFEMVKAALEAGVPYALAFVDMRMPPGWDGLETILRCMAIDPHLQVVIFGDVKLDSTGLHFMNPEYELVSDDLSSVHTGRLVPFYEKTGTVTPNMQRRLVRQALDQLPAELPDPVPGELRARLQLMPRRTAISRNRLDGHRWSSCKRIILAEQLRLLLVTMQQIDLVWPCH